MTATPTDAERLQQLLLPRNTKDELVAPPGWNPLAEVGGVGSDIVTSYSMQKLAPKQPLNDEVMNCEAARLNEANAAAAARAPRASGLPPRLGLSRAGAARQGRVHIWQSGFLSKLVVDDGTYKYDNVKAWTTRWTTEQFASIDVWCAVVHLRNHWALSALDIRAGKLHYYDSLYGSAINEGSEDRRRLLAARAAALSRWFADVSAARGVAVNTSSWTVVHDNVYDCGMFALAFARCISEGHNFDFTQRDIPRLRRELALRIADTGIARARAAADAAAAK